MELNKVQKEYIENKLNKLSKSKFRSSFQLRKYMIEYIDNKGMPSIEEHAYEIVKKRLGAAYPENDGKQTPTKNHPIFIAQHACACCCRSCLEKWHKIPRGKELEEREIKFIVALITEWIRIEYKKQKSK